MRLIGEKEGKMRGVNTEEALHLGDRRRLFPPGGGGRNQESIVSHKDCVSSVKVCEYCRVVRKQK